MAVNNDYRDTLITIPQARRILGLKGEKLTDEQITSFLNMLRRLSSKQIDSAIQKNHPKEEVKDE